MSFHGAASHASFDVDVSRKSASQALQILMNELALSQDGSDRWYFHDSLSQLPHGISVACTAQLRFISKLRENWRPRHSGNLAVPVSWLICPWINSASILMDIDLGIQAAGECGLSSKDVKVLSESDILGRHHDSKSWEPDFLYDGPKVVSEVTKGNLSAQSVVNPLKHNESCNDQDSPLEGDIRAIFSATPSCSFYSPASFDFPVELIRPKECPDIAFSLNIDPSAIAGTEQPLPTSTAPSRLPMAVMHPAALIGLRASESWRSDSSQQSKHYVDPCLSSIQSLALGVQPNLDAHLIQWKLIRDRSSPSTWCDTLLSPLESLPEWLLLFGLIYYSHSVFIVAHIPVFRVDIRPPRMTYLSIVLDTLPYAPAHVENPGAHHLDRIRFLLALLTLKRHAQRLASLWVSPSPREIWPPAIVHMEDYYESQRARPSSTSSDHFHSARQASHDGHEPRSSSVDERSASSISESLSSSSSYNTRSRNLGSSGSRSGSSNGHGDDWHVQGLDEWCLVDGGGRALVEIGFESDDEREMEQRRRNVAPAIERWRRRIC